MKSIAGMTGRVRVGAPDPSLTSASGLVAVAELADRLAVFAALDAAIGPIKQRDRGLSAGGLLLAVAQTQMLGGDFLSSLDRRRADTAGEALSAVPTPASTTASGLADRFTGQQLVAIEDGVAELVRRVMLRLPAKRRAVLRTGPVTIDLDGTDVECYGADKDGIAYNYKGQQAGRPHIASWAEAGVVVAADLLAGDEDPRRDAAGLIADTVATLRVAGVTARPRLRGDVGYFAAQIAWAAFKSGCDFCLGVARNQAVWRAVSGIPESAWVKAKRMRGAQVVVMNYCPAGWPPALRGTDAPTRPAAPLGRAGYRPSIPTRRALLLRREPSMKQTARRPEIMPQITQPRRLQPAPIRPARHNIPPQIISGVEAAAGAGDGLGGLDRLGVDDGADGAATRPEQTISHSNDDSDPTWMVCLTADTPADVQLVLYSILYSGNRDEKAIVRTVAEALNMSLTRRSRAARRRSGCPTTRGRAPTSAISCCGLDRRPADGRAHDHSQNTGPGTGTADQRGGRHPQGRYWSSSAAQPADGEPEPSPACAARRGEVYPAGGCSSVQPLLTMRV